MSKKPITILKGFPVYIQSDRFDCGPSCLKMITKFYGKSLSIEYLRDLSKIGPDGVSGKNLIAACQQLGFHTMPSQLSSQVLFEEAPLPCIIHWRNRHFVIVYKVSKTKVFVADPAYGLITYKKSEFVTAWQEFSVGDSNSKGIAILLEPGNSFYSQEDNENENGLSSLWPYLRNYSRYFYHVFIGLFLGMLIQLAIPFITQSLVDKGIGNNDLSFIYVLLIAQLTLFISRSLLDVFRSWLLLFIGARVSMMITADYLIRLMKKPLSFFDSKTPGDILQRINESKRVETFLNQAPTSIFSYVNSIVFMGVLAYYSWTIFIVFTLGVICYTLWIWFFMKRREKLDFKRFDASSSINSNLIQMVNGIQEVKVNGSENRHVWEWEKGRVKYYKNDVSNLKLAQFQNIGGSFINELKNILITFISAILVLKGALTLGQMLAIQFIIGQINTPLLNLVNFFRILQDANLSTRRLKEIDFETEEEKIINNNNLLQAEPAPGDISIKNLNFSYSGSKDEAVLKNINLEIPRGKVTAIVGPSGGGKTTLMKILLKMYLPDSGEIKVNGRNLLNIETNSWRENCSAVLQEGYIFSNTILNNITESRPYESLDFERLIEAVKLANMEDLINDLPSGFNSMIGPAGASGRTLSGGQRQRILIARAVYKNPNYLFFDEATSALDAGNESIIIQNLKEFNRKKTVVVIAHRLSTVKEADNIVVLDKGIIIENGNHEELVRKRGTYYRLIKNQLEIGS